jgi:hypothetical protein
MRMMGRDKAATIFVGVATVLYAAWLIAPTDAVGVRAVTAVVLALGFAASASAVVPGFERLWRGSRPYLAITSLIGLGASVAGILALVRESEAMLAVLMAATVVLWVTSTLRHAAAQGGARGGSSCNTRGDTLTTA